MAKWVHSDVLDNGISAIKANADKQVLLKAYVPGDSYATVNGTNKIAEVAMASGDYTLGSGSGSSRTLTTAAGKSATAGASSGATPDLHIAFVDTANSKVLWVTATSNVPVAAGDMVNFPVLAYTADQPPGAMSAMSQYVDEVAAGRGATLGGAEQQAVVLLVSGAWMAPTRMIGLSRDQPIAIARAVTDMGAIACLFGSGQWTATAGAPTLTQGYTGWDGAGNETGVTSITGQMAMLKAVPAANSTERITLGSVATNMLTKALGGKIGLWLYLESQPGYQVGGTLTGSIGLEISTNAGGTNPLWVSFSNQQLREGWNFLKFVMRNPLAYADGSGVSEYHPYGVAAQNFGTGAYADIVNNDVATFVIQWDNMLGSTLYFDSIWTGFASRPQFILGCDQGANFSAIARPILANYGWVGYCAFPMSVVDSGTANSTVQIDPSSVVFDEAAEAYAAGWDVINHSLTHPSTGLMTSEAAIVYQVLTAKSWLLDQGFIRGSEFFASPQGSSSRLSEKVIKNLGFAAQRHWRKSNCSVTAFGVDNPQHLGAIDMGIATSGGISATTSGGSANITGWQIFSKLRRYIDTIIAYGDTGHMYWHGVTTSGDTGSGEDATGNNLLLTRSAFELTMSYLREQEVAGQAEVCRGFTGWYHGSAQ